MKREELEQRKKENIERAKRVLQGADLPLADLKDLAKKLKDDRSFGYAWRILARARRKPEAEVDRALALELAQQQALCTYKDPDLPTDQKLDRAFEILYKADDLKTTTDQETLGLAGAIQKRRWEMDGQKQHMERALSFYRRGYQQGVRKDYGYTAINTAFVLDLLADQEEAEAAEAYTLSETSQMRRDEAQRIREEIADTLEAMYKEEDPCGNEWWFLVTVAEAYFGMHRYDKARNWLQKARALEDVPDWERESTARQLARLAQLRAHAGNGDEAEAARQALTEFLGDNVAAMRSVFTGKVGLALSGGGFRASLYHIGVLAKLAELDVLRHVEVLSCVSGGSITGAHYYLEVRKLFQEKEDGRITRDDYIEIVKRIERDFLEGVQTNVRTRVIAGWWTNVKMIFKSNYSRTMRVGELYEKQIYSRIEDRHEEEKYEPRWLNDLKVQPKGEAQGFSPKYDNWRRAAKVPILVLNATSLNTGHNWQFTATWMGEPPSAIDTDVDGNYRLRRMYYTEAPNGYKRYRLGYAVAASSCVPGLFEPLALPDLYEHSDTGERITVRLVDGGVHDNQGTASLLEQGCTVLLVSDASGQMNSDDDPRRGMLGVLKRSDSILQARVRQAQYRELEARRRASLLRGLMFIHLKMDLDVAPIDWIDCPEPFLGSEDARPAELRGPLTRYGINKKIQQRLAAVRTDLDSFCDAEAYALMVSGYQMTEYSFPKRIPGLELSTAARVEWRFLAAQKPIQTPTPDGKLTRLLEVAASLVFRIWKLSTPLKRGATAVGGLLAIGAIFWILSRWWGTTWLTFVIASAVIVMLLVGAPLMRRLVRAITRQKTAAEVALGLGFAVIGFAVARLHLHVFDKLYLRWGRASKLLK
ncbi:MAG: patatin-like phospholipase family protein [Blastocatellia bacterium]|nr:patatin-like phospholipase family protein [Blastocatellia bacterium]